MALLGVVVAVVLGGIALSDLPRAERAGTSSDQFRPARAGDLAKRGQAAVAAAEVVATPRPVAANLINSGTASAATIDMPGAAPASDGPTDDDDLDPAGSLADWYDQKRETFRTVCVRLCDGAMVPLSFATTRDRFGRDAKRCRASCGTETRLFVERNPPAEAGSGLVDLEGRAYATIANAYRFRTSVDAACSCRAEAWEHAALARHRLYAVRQRLAARRIEAAQHIAALKQAASRALRIAALTRPAPGPGAAAVVAEMPHARGVAPPTPSGASAVKRTSGRGAAPEDEVVAVAAEKQAAKPPVTRKFVAGSRKKKAPRDKAKPILVLFGPIVDGPVQKAAARAAYRDPTPQRRFDGTDWRISAYEPL